MRCYNKTMKKIVLAIIGLCVCLLVGTLIYTTYTRPKKTISSSPVASEPKKNQTEAFNLSANSLTEPTSIWVIVNKHHPLPVDFVPELTVPDVNLRLNSSEEQMQINTTTAPAIKDLFTAAKKDNINLVFGSGYRSGKLQTKFYTDYVAKDGVAQADTYSARPGFSEHQSGFSADIVSENSNCNMQTCWADTAEGKWLAQNASNFGFIIRYPLDKQSITGYQYEPWHIRYVGKDLALQIKKSKQTLEEFFKLESAPTYN